MSQQTGGFREEGGGGRQPSPRPKNRTVTRRKIPNKDNMRFQHAGHCDETYPVPLALKEGVKKQDKRGRSGGGETVASCHNNGV